MRECWWRIRNYTIHPFITDTLEELGQLVSGGNLTSCLYQTMCYLDQYGGTQEASTLHQLLDT